MVDRDRVLAKLDEMRGYVAELRSIAPPTLEDQFAREVLEVLGRP